MNQIYAFEVTVAGENWQTVINERTAGRAKAEYFRDLRDSWPSIPFTALRCRKLGQPRNVDGFKHTAEYRGLPDANCGDRVRVGDALGVIVGKNCSANFNVLFDDDAPAYGGQVLNVHPASIDEFLKG